MTTRTLFKFALAAALPLVVGFAALDTAAAQTATDLKCRKCVGARDLGKKAVKKRSLKKNAVTGAKIRDGSITSKDLGNGAITGEKLADGAVAADQLEIAAKPTGVEYVEDEQEWVELTVDRDIVESIVVSAPGPGYVFVTAEYESIPMDADAASVCQIEYQEIVRGSQKYTKPGTLNGVPVSLTRVVPVESAGDARIDLSCRENPGNMVLSRIGLIGLFIPARY
jgi:hypothetical protein